MITLLQNVLTYMCINTVDRFKSSVTWIEYWVKAMANCKTSNVVYVIECNKCKLQYAGKMENELHIRMDGHQPDIKHRCLEITVAKHFNLINHSLEDLSTFIIEKIN